MTSIRTILFPTDLFPGAAGAFAFARSLARDYGARLVVMTAYPSSLTGAEGVDRGRVDGVAADLLAALRRLGPPGRSARVEYRVEEGRPADAILGVADEESADLIVMGTHGRTGLWRAVAGSVAERVSRRARCPVMTVRPAAAPAADPPFPPAPAWSADDVEAGPDNWHLAGPEDDPVREIAVPFGRLALRGTLRWAGEPRGVVIFAHGSGSSRFSPRNRAVADVLVRAGFATLLLDLLTAAEADDRADVFDTELLAARLAAAADWVAGLPGLAGLPVGYFGASTGAAAALTAAAMCPDRVAAVVCRGGRPDLAADDLPGVVTPTLLIVGGEDGPVVACNREAYDRLACERELVVIPGATHLFEEPGALDQVAALARDWFARHLTPVHAGAARG